MDFDPKKWFEGLKEIVIRDIQIIYFTVADDEYRKKVNDTIKDNELESIELDKIVIKSPNNPKDAQLKLWEIKSENKNNDALLDLYNKQVMNVYTDFSGLSEEEQKKVLKYANNHKYRVTILSQIRKEEYELCNIVKSRLEKLSSGWK